MVTLIARGVVRGGAEAAGRQRRCGLSHSDHFVLNFASLAPGVFEITYSPFMFSPVNGLFVTVACALPRSASAPNLIIVRAHSQPSQREVHPKLKLRNSERETHTLLYSVYTH